MDLVKFIHRQRFVNFAVISLLSGFQHKFLSRISYPVLRESTDSETSSEDDNKLGWVKDNTVYLDKLAAAKDPVSSRIS